MIKHPQRAPTRRTSTRGLTGYVQGASGGGRGASPPGLACTIPAELSAFVIGRALIGPFPVFPGAVS
jgi:hypothetical protein